MLILLLTVFRLYLRQSQTHYQVHNNTTPHVDCITTNLSTSSCAKTYSFSDESSYLYDCTTSYPTALVVFQGSKSLIDINFFTYNLKASSTLLNGSSISFIKGITTPFSLHNIEQNYSSLKNGSQFQ